MQQFEDIDSLEQIITTLNLTKFTKKPSKTKQRIQQEIIVDTSEQSDSLEQFQKIYEDKLSRELKKKKTLSIKVTVPPQSTTSSSKLSQLTGLQPLVSNIRYLSFKNWSGNHIFEKNDSGYRFRFSCGPISLIKNLLEENGFVESPDHDFSILWNNGVPKPETFQSLNSYQKINHFPKSFEITRKDLMLRNISKMQTKFGPVHYNFLPKTFILPAESSDFTQYHEKQQKTRNAHWYIVKPHNQSQGRGIWVTNSGEEILAKQKDCIVVSQYIANPLLINGLKFDLRVYVAITCFNPLKIYIYEQGLTRFATYQYSKDLNSLENPFVHLTNYSLNKNSDQFVVNQDQTNDYVGHKWSLSVMKEYLVRNGYDLNLLWGRVEDLVVKTIISIQNQVFSALQMSVPYRDNCFQVLGFDILIDEDLKPWLVEVNLSPSLNTDSPLDLKIKGNMIADLFTLAGVVPLDQRYSVDKSYMLNSNKTGKVIGTEQEKLKNLVLKEFQEELGRARGWKLAYPTQTAVRYKQFFDIDRSLNKLLRQQHLKKIKQSHSNYSNIIKQISSNIQPMKKK